MSGTKGKVAKTPVDNTATTAPDYTPSGATNIINLTQRSQQPYVPQPTVNDMNSYVPQGISPEQREFYERQNQLSADTGALPESTYFPTANTPIAKGNYSGSEIGSTTLFAPSNLVPFGLYDAREHALQQAAMAKVKRDQDALSWIGKPIQTKRTNVQPELAKTFMDWNERAIAAAQKEYGDNWSQMLKNDKNYQQGRQNFETIAKFNDDIVDVGAKLHELYNKKDYVVPPNVEKLVHDIAVTSSYADPNTFEGRNLYGDLQSAKGVLNAYQLINDLNLNPSVTESISKSVDGVNDVYKTTKITQNDKNALDAAAQGIYFQSQGTVPLDEIKKAINARYQRKIEVDLKTANNEKNKDGDGADATYTNKDFTDTPDILTNVMQHATFGKENGKVVKEIATRQAQTISKDGLAFKKPITVIAPAGASLLNASTGEPLGAGVQKVEFGYGSNTLVHSGDFHALPKDWQSRPEYAQDNVKGIYNPTVWGVATIKNGDKDQTIPVYGRMSDFENALVRAKNDDGTVKTGIPTDVFNKKAEALNNGSAPATAPAAPKASHKPAMSVSAYNKAKGKNYTRAQIEQHFGTQYTITD